MSTAPTPIDYASLDFEGFRRLATEPGRSRHERVGFPDSYREGKEQAIFADLLAKLPALQRTGATVMEIGPGCSALPLMLAGHCAAREQRLLFVDSAEMLALLPDAPRIEKIAGAFPQALGAQAAALAGQVDAIVAYSVMQYVFAEGNLWQAFDQCLALLADGGELLIGDLPNQSMRKRFFASDAGAAQHRAYTGRDEKPEVRFNQPEPGQIDDSVVLSLLMRARAAGFHAWVLPQPAHLPMGNRREDLLVRKP